MKKIILFLFIISFSVSVSAQSDSKTVKVRQLLEVTNASKLSTQILNAAIQSMQSMHKDVNQKFWTKFSSEFNADGLVELLVPVYAKYYSEEDLDQLIAFYKTPVGQKTLSILPQIMQESFTIGQEWGKNIATKILHDLKAEGYLNDNKTK